MTARLEQLLANAEAERWGSEGLRPLIEAQAALIALAPDMARLLIDMGDEMDALRVAYGHLMSMDEAAALDALLARLDALGKDTA